MGGKAKPTKHTSVRNLRTARQPLQLCAAAQPRSAAAPPRCASLTA